MASLKLTAVLVVLSLVVLAMAAFFGPNSLNFVDPTNASAKSAAEFDAKLWCEEMENKPNKEWLESDFKLFAALCLGD